MITLLSRSTHITGILLLLFLSFSRKATGFCNERNLVCGGRSGKIWNLKVNDINKSDFIFQFRSPIIRFKYSKKPSEMSETNVMNYFVPAFVFLWAAGYLGISYADTMAGGLGDLGGTLGIGLVVILFFSLFAVTAYESFKPDD